MTYEQLPMFVCPANIVSAIEAGAYGSTDWKKKIERTFNDVMCRKFRDVIPDFLDSVKTNGVCQPINFVFDWGTPVLTNGHHRLATALYTGITYIPARWGHMIDDDWFPINGLPKSWDDDEREDS